MYTQVVRSREGEMIYLGTQSVLLQTGLLITKAEYPATPQRPVFVTGRVEFLDVSHSAAGKDGDMRKDEVRAVLSNLSLWILTHKLAANFLPFESSLILIRSNLMYKAAYGHWRHGGQVLLNV